MQLNEERIKITKDIKERKYNSIIKLREEQNQYLDKIRTETNEEMKIKEQKRKEEIEKFQKWIKDSNDQKERKNDLFKRKKVDDNVFLRSNIFVDEKYRINYVKTEADERNKALNDSNKLYDELFKEKQRKLKEEEEKFLRDLNVRNENLMKIDSDRKQKNSKLVSQMKDLLQKQQKINNERKFAEKKFE